MSDEKNGLHRVRRELDGKIGRNVRLISSMGKKVSAIHAMLVEDGFKKSMVDLQKMLHEMEPRMVAMEARAVAEEALELHSTQVRKYRRQNITLWIAIASIVLGIATFIVVYLRSSK